MSDATDVMTYENPGAGTDAGAVTRCVWCEGRLQDVLEAMKEGACGEDVRRLHSHLIRFGMGVELGGGGEPGDTTEVKTGAWGRNTTRAVRMFARHPAVGGEQASATNSDGKSIDGAVAQRIRAWCTAGVCSPQSYWGVAALLVKPGDRDVLGSKDDAGEQTVLHDFVSQIQRDLARTGFAPHEDGLCGCGCEAKPTGSFSVVPRDGAGLHIDRGLTDTAYLIRKFQRQAGWLWRMDTAGRQLPDATEADGTVYRGVPNGCVDHGTASVLHAWAERGLHMVIGKFPLEGLTWPPGGAPIVNSPGTSQARLREDAYRAWLRAAESIQACGGTIGGPYASSPRGWVGGKPKESSASAYSWHLAGLAIDICQAKLLGDGSVTDRAPYGLEIDGTKFRIWCRVVPQPEKPADPAADKADAVKQYRNRNIQYKHPRGKANEVVRISEPADPKPLYFATTAADDSGTSVKEVAAREGWYVDITSIMETNGLLRIPRHRNWVTHSKSWEWWHYQYVPVMPAGATAPPTFGEYMQLHGVHELKLRRVANGWPSHEDMEHSAG